MLAAIGLDRGAVYIANIVPWRPPGNREPTPQEVAICKPFIERQIELADPDILVCLGGASAHDAARRQGRHPAQPRALVPLPDRGATSARSRRCTRPISCASPLQKRLAWRDFRALRRALDEKTGPA